eukprot:TRINITY_DN8957_c0_g2_i1.p1 TRINITY_DN8957_c0_g2~~TRINITY_DN8957_c0_g2_i1.p1  ORF type:complete len:445 (-),score=88.21 TRINITY_DN8957_c0_g2_i1:79-1392(-)
MDTVTLDEGTLAWVRSQYPALDKKDITGKVHDVIYLDGPGGSQVPQSVADAVSRYMLHTNANSGGVFDNSRDSDAIIQATREAMGDFLGCSHEEIAFGANMTTLTFSVSRALGRDLRDGDEIIVTQLDHDGNVAPWTALKVDHPGVNVHMLQVTLPECFWDLDHLSSLLNEKTKIVALGAASNAVGTVNDLEGAIRIIRARSPNAIVYVDAVHLAPHFPIDVRALDCDFLACSAYKFFGPHIGILYGKKDLLLSRTTPFKVTPADNVTSVRWETGTQNHEGIAGTLAAIQYIEALGEKVAAAQKKEKEEGAEIMTRRQKLLLAMNAIRNYERSLFQGLLEDIKTIPNIKIFGVTDVNKLGQRTPTLALDVSPPLGVVDVARRLAAEGVYTWAGTFYAIHIIKQLAGERGKLLRIGLTHYNTKHELKRFVDILKKALE